MRCARVFVVAMMPCACADAGPSDDDPLGCDLPEPCEVANLAQGSVELEPQTAATCIFDAIISGEPAHLRQVFSDVRVVTYDVYIRGDEPAVITELDCEIDGPCMELEADRCIFEIAEYLDCSNGMGPQRVCGGAIEWCMTSSVIEPTCP